MKGFTIIEILVGIGILVIVATLSVSSFFGYSQKEILDKSVLKIESLLEEARSAGYGVHFSSNQINFFNGNNEEYILPNSIVINVELIDEGNDIIFDKIAGTTDQYGTITVSLSTNADLKKTIIIYKTGLIENI
ncbi:MAG: type II secretion system GspH family protein [Patescibacteria group bacterium]|nr:type II secretion system GspH family protein [Patescibacteria group bacterium]